MGWSRCTLLLAASEGIVEAVHMLPRGNCDPLSQRTCARRSPPAGARERRCPVSYASMLYSIIRTAFDALPAQLFRLLHSLSVIRLDAQRGGVHDECSAS